MKTRIPKALLESLPKLRGISIRQPFAEQILRGTKKIEYRSRTTNIRERVYIYASLGERPLEDWKTAGIAPYSLPTGVVVGTVEIVGCTPSRKFPGDNEWHLARPERLETLLPPKEHAQPIWFYPFGRPAAVISEPSANGTASQPATKIRRKRRKSHRRATAVKLNA